jgi:beta-glucosidase
METAIDGFQGSPGHLSDPDRVLSTAKHFAGDGLTTYGTGSNMHTTGNYPIDQGVDQVDHATFDRLALSPYVTAVRQHHVGSVMPSYSDVDWTEDGLGNRINMHGNRDLITGWLKDRLGFSGFLISDYHGIRSPTAGTSTRSVRRRITLWLAARPPSPRCCSRTVGTRCPSRAATTSMSRAPMPTTSATRPAVGR